jgi:large subunit ribosomal protein L9
MIEVILLERIERLGTMGQLVKVRPGFARNFLLPQKKALRATKANLEIFEKQRVELEARNAAERTAAQALAAEMDNLHLTIIRQASDTGQLFGSVSAKDIADAGKETKHTITRPQVQIDTPIKTLGLFPVKVKLHPEVTVKITVNVARSPEEAAVQLAKGVAVIKAAAKAEVEAAAAAADVAAVEAAGGKSVDAPETKKSAKKAKAKKTAEDSDAKYEKKSEDKAEAEAPKVKKSRAKKTAEK